MILIAASTKLFRFSPFPKRQILDSSKLKEFADGNFKFDENDRKFSKRVENTVGKGEIARYGVFKRLVLHTRKNQGLFAKGLNEPGKEAFPRHSGKRKKCWKRAFSTKFQFFQSN